MAMTSLNAMAAPNHTEVTVVGHTAPPPSPQAFMVFPVKPPPLPPKPAHLRQRGVAV